MSTTELVLAALENGEVPKDGILYKEMLLELSRPEGWEFYWLEGTFDYPFPYTDRLTAGEKTLYRLEVQRGEFEILKTQGYVFFLGGNSRHGVWRIQ